MKTFAQFIEEKQLEEGFWGNVAAGAAAVVSPLMGATYADQPAEKPAAVQSQDQVIKKGNSPTFGEWKLVKSPKGSYAVIFSSEKFTGKNKEAFTRAAQKIADKAFMDATGSNMQGVEHGVKTIDKLTYFWYR